MVSQSTQNEIESYLGQVPSWIAELSEPAADHSWGLVRDLQFDDTELSAREKALVGLGAASAIQCPYCTHFQGTKAELEGVTDVERTEVVNLAAGIRYFSTVFHGAEVDHDEFVDETAEIAQHVVAEREATGR